MQTYILFKKKHPEIPKLFQSCIFWFESVFSVHILKAWNSRVIHTIDQILHDTNVIWTATETIMLYKCGKWTTIQKWNTLTKRKHYVIPCMTTYNNGIRCVTSLDNKCTTRSLQWHATTTNNSHGVWHEQTVLNDLRHWQTM